MPLYTVLSRTSWDSGFVCAGSGAQSRRVSFQGCGLPGAYAPRSLGSHLLTTCRIAIACQKYGYNGRDHRLRIACLVLRGMGDDERRRTRRRGSDPIPGPS